MKFDFREKEGEVKINLMRYTSVRRGEKKHSLRFGNITNDWIFDSEKELSKFKKLYNLLAVEALKKMMSLIKETNIYKNSSKNEKDLAFLASTYYVGGGMSNIPSPNLEGVLKKTEELYENSKNLRYMKSCGLI